MPFPLMDWSKVQVMFARLVMLAEGSPGVLMTTVEVPIQVSAQTPGVVAPASLTTAAEKQLTSSGMIELGATSRRGVGILVFTSAANWYLPGSLTVGTQCFRNLSPPLEILSIDFQKVNCDSLSAFWYRSTRSTL